MSHPGEMREGHFQQRNQHRSMGCWYGEAKVAWYWWNEAGEGGGPYTPNGVSFPVDSGEHTTVVAREWHGCTCVLERSG